MQIKVIENKNTEYQIVVPDFAEPVEKTGAEELRQYIHKAFGAQLSVVSEKEAKGKAFYIGHTEYAKDCGVLGSSRENWVIKMHGGNIILTGGTEKNDRGIIYAVYHFLEDVVGVRWWSYWEEYVPDLSELTLQDDFYKEGTPVFPYRKVLSSMEMDHFYFEARNRGNVVGDDGIPGGVNHPSIKKLGGARHMGGPHHCHTLPEYIPPKEFFQIHPEWFAWKEARKEHVFHGHYCLTNEELVEAISVKLMAYIEEDQKQAREKGLEMPYFYSISFPDAEGGFCQCEKCKAVLNKSGESGYALQFVNQFARRVAEKYPGIKIETLIYSLYLNPPKDDTLPEKNVILRLAQVYVDIIHGVHDKGNKWYLGLLQSWSEICKKAGCELYIWDYMYNLFLDFPMPLVYRLSDTFQAFHQYGVSGIFIENECLTMDMWELNHFVMMHLCEDPYADAEALIDDFLTKFYGPAASYVKAYLQELKRAATENDYSVFCIIESAHFNFLDVAVYKKGMILLEQAMVAVKGDAVYELRIRYMQALLGASLVMKYRDLKQMAERMGESFDFDWEAIRHKALYDFEESKRIPRISYNLKRIQNTMDYLGNLSFDEEISVQLPQELAGVDASDVYQVFFKNLSRHINNGPERFGFSVVEDKESSTGKVARICLPEATDPNKVTGLFVTSKEAEYKQPLSFYIEQDTKPICGIELYREDIIPDTYYLYKVGSVFGIKASGDTRVDIFDNGYDWVSLTGISVLFPMDACDVYLSMKFTGEMYGGSKKDKDTIYIDRVIVVRR